MAALALTDAQREALTKVVDYLIDDERADYHCSDSERRAGHIYRHVYTLSVMHGGWDLEDPDTMPAD